MEQREIERGIDKEDPKEELEIGESDKDESFPNDPEIISQNKKNETRKADMLILLEIERMKDLSPEIRKILTEVAENAFFAKDLNHPDGEKIIGELSNFLHFIFQDENWVEIWDEIDKLSNLEGFAKAGEKKKEIIASLSLPILNGHLTAEDTLNLVEDITLFEDSDSGSLTGQIGYSPTLAYREGRIFINKRALRDTFDENNPQFELNLTHSIAHELSHGATEQIYFGTDHSLGKDVITLASKLITNPELNSLLPTHIFNVLNKLKESKKDYLALSDETKRTLEKSGISDLNQYETFRQKLAIKEIVTDFLAIYLQSDGTLEDFMMQGIKVTAGKADIKKSPHLSKLTEVYGLFHKSFSKDLPEFKGEFESIAGETTQEIFDFDSMFDGNAFYEPAIEGDRKTQGNSNPVTEAVSLAKSFFDELGWS